MSMTRAEAIDWFEQVRDIAKRNLGEKWTRGCEKHYQLKVDLAEAALTALRPVSREQVEKAEWIWSTGDVYICSSCGEKTYVDECMGTPIYNFCPFCMAPMTDEAVQMVMERLEALKDGKGV